MQIQFICPPQYIELVSRLLDIAKGFSTLQKHLSTNNEFYFFFSSLFSLLPYILLAGIPNTMLIVIIEALGFLFT